MLSYAAHIKEGARHNDGDGMGMPSIGIYSWGALHSSTAWRTSSAWDQGQLQGLAEGDGRDAGGAGGCSESTFAMVQGGETVLETPDPSAELQRYHPARRLRSLAWG